MRQILVFSLIFLAVPLALFAPFTGLISYVGIAYVRPHEWAYMPNAPISLAVAVATLIGYAIFELTRRAPQLIPNSLLLLLWAQVSLATLFAYSPELAQGKWIEFSKTILIALLMTAMVDSERRVRWLLLGTVGAIGFLAFRSNVGILLAGGQARIFGPGGAFEDNNDYALLLNVAAPIAFYVGRAETNRWLRRICYALSAMMMITVLFSLSRGGFLGLCLVLVGLALKSKHKVAGILAVVLAGSIAFALLPNRVVERVGTIRTATQADESAQLRFEAWRVSLQIISDYPLLGVGPRNIVELYSRYQQPGQPAAAGRVSHNSFLQIAVDAGLPALMLFLSMIGVSFFRLRRARQILKTSSPDSPLIAYSHGLEVALLGYFVSANFLSRHDLELLYEVIALATSLAVLTREAVVQQSYASPVTSAISASSSASASTGQA